MDLATYIDRIAEIHEGRISTEHSLRRKLQELLEELLPDVDITNEPRPIACGAPDLVLTRRQIPLGYIETKHVHKSLDAHQEQLQRYVEALDNLIFTNYLEFRFYRNGDMKPRATVSIAELRGGNITALPENFAKFSSLIQSFGAYEGQTITAPNDLAERMANKTRLMAAVIEEDLKDESGSMNEQLQAFKKILIGKITVGEFADMYAQTIAYGMFAACLHARNLADFSRREAAELIPKSNPFLRKFFGYIAYDLDEGIRWIVDDLADIFRASNVEKLMKNFGKTTGRSDPFIHFYETFLSKYDKKARKSRGVYYTPEPVVNFIVRAVDEILKTEFHLPDGLAGSEKTTVTVEDRPKEVHRLQILDPATGTGTFLAEVVKQIHRKFAGQQGAWPGYVKENLIPRLNGFEVLMAPYVMAHLKLELILRESFLRADLERDPEETHRRLAKNPLATDDAFDGERLRIFLTNSLEEYHSKPETSFVTWLSDESRAANFIKRDLPVMVVLGNPPYSGESANKGKWIAELLQDYKYIEPGGGKLKLQEKNSKWINDDYVKFIRYGEYLIEETGEGVLAYINNHSFLDNPTFRGMRWNLLQSFDVIYIIDLHGNSKKKERAPDGSVDKNVFDIQQGVSINLFVKTGKKKGAELARVFHHDLYMARRQSKYKFLWDSNFTQIDFAELKPQAPQYFFVPMDYELQSEYELGFSVNELFSKNSALA